MSEELSIVMGQAILLQERVSRMLHERQRSQDLERAPVHERIASVMSSMNAELSSPDERRESLLSRHTKGILRNSAVKAQLAI